MSHRTFELSLTALLIAGFAACSKDGEQAAPWAPDAQSATETPAASTETSAAPSGSLAMKPGQGAMMQRMQDSCPMVVDGTKVEVSDTPGGVALSFATDAEHLSELREHVERMATMYGMHRGRGHMMWHRMGPTQGTADGHGMGMGPGHGMGMGPGHGMGGGAGPMPAATAKVEQTADGARLVLTPTESTQLDMLRQEARWHAERMQSHECWMLEEEPSAANAR